MSEKAFLVDTTRCSGCRACQVACKGWNGLPGEKTEFFGGPEYTNPAELSAITWNHVKFFPVDRSNPEKPNWTIMHKKCYHCAVANCLNVCPEKAISKVDGWTVIDQSKCIGCGACEEECVYSVPRVSDREHINDTGITIVHKEKSHKCNACTLIERDIPACVATCPTGALTIGDRPAVISRAKKRLKEIKSEYPDASIYGLNEFGGLGVITILKNKPEKFGLPEGDNAKPVSSARAAEIRDLYRLLSTLTLGLPSLKRLAYRTARSIVRGNVRS